MKTEQELRSIFAIMTTEQRAIFKACSLIDLSLPKRQEQIAKAAGLELNGRTKTTITCLYSLLAISERWTAGYKALRDCALFAKDLGLFDEAEPSQADEPSNVQSELLPDDLDGDLIDVTPRLEGNDLHVYIAGPMTTSGEPGPNVHAAANAAANLMAIPGVTPIVPHVSWFLHMVRPDVPVERWMDWGLSLVRSSDVVLRLPGESRGSDAEAELARSLQKPVVHSVAEVIEIAEGHAHATIAVAEAAV
ncbi:MAG: DUF4406 domain-containing protein [Solirubrobacterales bacterium]